MRKCDIVSLYGGRKPKVQRQPVMSRRAVPVGSVEQFDDTLSVDLGGPENSEGIDRRAHSKCAQVLLSQQGSERLLHESISHLTLTEEARRSHIASLEEMSRAHTEHLRRCHDAFADTAEAGVKENSHPDGRDKMMLRYAEYLRLPPNMDASSDKALNEGLHREIDQLKAENTQLQREYAAHVEYSGSIRESLANQEADVTSSRRNTAEAHALSRQRRIDELVDERREAIERERAARVQKQIRTNDFVKKYGDYERRVIAAAAIRDANKAKDKETDRLRRGFIKRHQAEAEELQAMHLPDEKHRQHRLEAAVDHHRNEQERRNQWLASRSSPLTEAAAAREAAFVEANRIRLSRQEARHNLTAITAKDAARFQKARESSHMEHTKSLQRRFYDDELANAAVMRHMAERIQMREELRTEAQSVERHLTEIVHQQWKTASSTAKARTEERSVSLLQLYGEAHSQRVKADDAFANELDSLRKDHRETCRKAWFEKRDLLRQRREMQKERDELDRQNAVLKCRISSTMAADAIILNSYAERLAAQHKASDSGPRHISPAAEKQSVLAVLYSPEYRVQTAMSPSKGGTTISPPLIDRLPTSKPSKTVLPCCESRAHLQADPPELPSLVFPTRSAIRKFVLAGKSGPAVASAERILELESELEQLRGSGGSPARVLTAMSDPRALQRLTERSITHDARVAMRNGVIPEAKMEAAEVPHVHGCSSRLYNPITLGRSSAPIPETLFVKGPQGRAKSTDALATHFHDEAIAEHAKVLQAASQRALRSSSVTRGPCHPQAFISNTADRLLFSPIRNQRHSPVDSERPKASIDPDVANERFFTHALEEQKQWTRALEVKYKLKE